MKTITIKSKSLIDFLRGMSMALDDLDEIMTAPEGNERGRNVGKWATRVEFGLDAFLHQELSVPLDKLKDIKKSNFKLP